MDKGWYQVFIIIISAGGMAFWMCRKMRIDRKKFRQNKDKKK